MTQDAIDKKYGIVRLDSPILCQFKHPSQTCTSPACWEHSKRYYCSRHYYALAKGWPWVNKYQWCMPHLRKD